MHNGNNAYCIIVYLIAFNCFSVSNTIVDSLSIKIELILTAKLKKCTFFVTNTINRIVCFNRKLLFVSKVIY